MNHIRTLHSIRNKRIFTYLNSTTFKYQHTLILLLFVSATLIFLDLGVFSVSFIFGAALILITLSRKPALLKPKGLMWFLFAFLVVILLSLIFSEQPFTFSHLKIYIQTIYWFLLALIVYNIYPFIIKQVLSKYILYSVFLLLGLYIFGLKVGTQNSVAFTVIILAPLGYYCIRSFWYKAGFAALLIFLMLLNGSRSGALISFFQSFMIIILSLPRINKHFKALLTVGFLIVILFNTESIRVSIGYFVEPYNTRLGEFLIEPDFVMSNDMSWLTRQAQIQKAKQIFAKYPLFGIGYSNFVDFDIIIDESKIISDRPLNGIDNRSAHNSYIEVLSETGLIGFMFFVSFFITIFILFWKNTYKIVNTFEAYTFVSLIGFLIYFYTISAYAGTSSWIIYGLAAGAAKKVKFTKFDKIKK